MCIGAIPAHIHSAPLHNEIKKKGPFLPLYDGAASMPSARLRHKPIWWVGEGCVGSA